MVLATSTAQILGNLTMVSAPEGKMHGFKEWGYYKVRYIGA